MREDLRERRRDGGIYRRRDGGSKRWSWKGRYGVKKKYIEREKERERERE